MGWKWGYPDWQNSVLFPPSKSGGARLCVAILASEAPGSYRSELNRSFEAQGHNSTRSLSRQESDAEWMATVVTMMPNAHCLLLLLLSSYTGAGPQWRKPSRVTSFYIWQNMNSFLFGKPGRKGSLTCKNSISKLSLPMHSFILCLLTGCLWLSTSSSCQAGFSTMIECNVEFWVKINSFFPELSLIR